jgi:hypothetical protein
MQRRTSKHNTGKPADPCFKMKCYEGNTNTTFGNKYHAAKTNLQKYNVAKYPPREKGLVSTIWPLPRSTQWAPTNKQIDKNIYVYII